MIEGPFQHGPVKPQEESHEGILPLVMEPPPDKEGSKNRNQRQCEQGRPGHRVGLGEGQGMEELSRLASQGEDRNKGQQDDQHREENRADHQMCRPHHDGKDIFRVGETRHPPLLHGMSFSDHGLGDHDPGIHKDADGDGQSAKRHDVGSDTCPLHQDESDQDREGEREGDDDHASQVSQEKEMSQRDQKDLLDQRDAQRAHRPVDQLTAIVEGLDRDSAGKRFTDLGNLLLHLPDDLLGALPIAHDDDSPDSLAPTHIESSPPRFGTHTHGCHLPEQNGATIGVSDRQRLQVIVGTNQRDSSDGDVSPGDLDIATADISAGSPDFFDHGGKRQTIGTKSVGIDIDLILANKPPDARHFGNPRHGIQLKPDEPILERTELTQIQAMTRLHCG